MKINLKPTALLLNQIYLTMKQCFDSRFYRIDVTGNAMTISVVMCKTRWVLTVIRVFESTQSFFIVGDR